MRGAWNEAGYATRTRAIHPLLERAAAYFKVPLAALLSPSRLPLLVRTRWLAMALLRAEGLSLPQIGRIVDRDHTTVLHGLRRVAADAELRRAVRNCSQRLSQDEDAHLQGEAPLFTDHTGPTTTASLQ